MTRNRDEMPLLRLTKREIIEELNDMLDDLSPNEARDMFSRLTLQQLLRLQRSLQAKAMRQDALKSETPNEDARICMNGHRHESEATAILCELDGPGDDA